MASSPQTPRPGKRPVRWRPSAGPLATIAVIAFLAISGFLGYRVVQGEDPALGNGRSAAVTSTQSSSDSTSTEADSGWGDDEGSSDDDSSSSDDGGSYDSNTYGSPGGSQSSSASSNPSTGTSG